MHKLRQKGFTLIELLIVIVIIAILVALLAVSYTTIQRNARDTQRKGDLATVAGVLERFYGDNSIYPADNNDGDLRFESGDCTVDTPDTTTTWGTSPVECGGKTYTRQLPIDPLRDAGTAQQYCYVSLSSNQQYEIYAAFEGRGNYTGAVPGDCSGTYNYRITSSD